MHLLAAVADLAGHRPIRGAALPQATAEMNRDGGRTSRERGQLLGTIRKGRLQDQTLADLRERNRRRARLIRNLCRVYGCGPRGAGGLVLSSPPPSMRSPAARDSRVRNGRRPIVTSDNVTPFHEPGAPPRLPPINIEAEQALLGAFLCNNRWLEAVADFLKPKYFASARLSRPTSRAELQHWLRKATLRGFATVELLPIELKLLPRWGWRRVC
jgi:hypothetical protein